MRTTRRLLNGDTVTLDVPSATALPESTAIGVLSLDGAELELTSGSPAALEFYLSLSGSALTGQLSLRSGPVLRHGRYGGDPASGLAFAVAVGDHEVYGFTPPSMDAETLAGFLTQVGFEPGRQGPALRLGGGVTWSTYRTHTLAQVVRTGDERGLLLDVRRTVNPRLSGSAGIDVKGGRLSRSAPEERHAYAILEATDFVTYGIPGDESDLDMVAGVLAQVTTELR
jgi:hypothetical protein